MTVDSWDGLLSEYMKLRNEHIVIRGVRSGEELEQELGSASANRMLNDQVETIFIPSDPGLRGISSSTVREIAAFGGDISAFVPETVTKEIMTLLSKENKE